MPAVGSAFRGAGKGGRFTSAAGVVDLVGMVGAVTEYDTRVATRSVDPAPPSVLAPYSGCAMAEPFSGDGLHALETHGMKYKQLVAEERGGDWFREAGGVGKLGVYAVI